MPLQVTPLPPDPSLIRALALHLMAGAPSGPLLDLTQTVVIVPAARAQGALARHLQELAGRPVLLPTILTPGRSLAHFVIPDRTAAGDNLVTLACFQAIVAIDRADPKHLSALRGTANDAVDQFQLATRTAALLVELSRAGCTPASVHERGLAGALGEFFPAETWSALSAVAARTSQLLAEHGLDLPHAIAARAIDSGRLATHGVHRVVVLLADPDPMERALLRTLAERGITVDVVVHDAALPGLEAGFPSHAEWAAARPVVPLDRVVRVAGLDEQPAVVLTALDAMPHPVAPDSVAIAALGPTDAAILSRTLASNGIPIAMPPARTADQGTAALLLSAVSAWIADPTALNLGTLLRHPWVEQHLHAAGLHAALRSCTLYAASTGVRRLDAALPELPDPKREGSIAAGLGAIRTLLHGVQSAADGRARVLALHALVATLQPSHASMADGLASQAVARALLALAEAPTALLSPCSHAEVTQLALAAARRVDLPSEHHDGIECMGWLEAGVCDAEHVIVLSANDGLLPEAAVVDPWLPDALRQSLGLPCARARRARDAWIIDGLLKRKRAVWFGVPATASDGEPLRPSRFLIGGGTDQAERTLALTGDSGRVSLRGWSIDQRVGPGFASHPGVADVPPITRLSVTQFKRFLECPYEFFRSCVLHAERRDDLQLELDPMAFGNLVHHALQEWGRTEAALATPTTDPSAVATALDAALDRVVAARQPGSVHGAVAVQVSMARERLRAFAPRQAEWAAKGWKVTHVELAFEAPKPGAPTTDAVGADDGEAAVEPTHHPAPQFPDHRGLYLSGRIDRVDHHAASGAWAALDYKTSSEPADPNKHRAKDGWNDLQLPLYRELLASIGIPRDQLQLGLIALPAQAELAAITLAEWSPEIVDEAVEIAGEIVHQVQSARTMHDFAPSGKPPMGDDPLLLAVHGIGMRGLAQAGPTAADTTTDVPVGGGAS
jgi:inactivated superfamily I helicase